MDQEREKQLRDWLKKPEARNLATVIAAKLRAFQEKALLACGKSTGENAYALMATAAMKDAQRYQITLDVLDEIAGQAEPYQILKYKP